MTDATATPDSPELEPALLQALTAFAAAPERVVALDFDGVLAPFVDVPSEARPLPESVAALQRIAADPTTHLGLISGRKAADVALLRAAPPSTAIYGSHGAESGTIDADGNLVAGPPALTASQQELLASLGQHGQALVDSYPGAWLESKPTAVVVHSRGVSDDQSARDLEQSAQELGNRPHVRTIAGKRVVELSVASATKGDAVTLLRQGRQCAVPVLFAGDDVTDEDALAALGAGDIGIKVGDDPTCAAFRVSDPQEFAQVLEALADLVAPSTL